MTGQESGRQPNEITHNDRSVADILGDDEPDLKGANLRGADLRDAYLKDADLRDAYLRCADLKGADLEDATLPNYQIVPEEGSFVAFKATSENILRLRIPEDADRTSTLTSRKCRASAAVVEEVLNRRGEPCEDTEASGWYDESFIYNEGGRVEPDEYDDDIRVDCSNGIHFFVTKDEAMEWL